MTLHCYCRPEQLVVPGQVWTAPIYHYFLKGFHTRLSDSRETENCEPTL